MVIQTLADIDAYLKTVRENERPAALIQLKKLVVRRGRISIVGGIVEPPPPKREPFYGRGMPRGF